MTTTMQGEFANQSQAERAAAALRAAGIPAVHVRIWNIIPPSKHQEPSTYAQKAGTVTGALLGGLAGAVAGNAVGRVVDSVNEEPAHLPEPTGVRVVVDLSAASPDVARILREHGAANVG